MANVGYASLQIIPSVRGISEELKRQLVGPAEEAATEAGDSAGGGFGDAFKGALAGLGIAELASKMGEQLMDGITQAMEQGDLVSTLQAQLGATNKQAAVYGKVAGRLYTAGVTDTFEQATDAIRTVMQSGIAPPDATVAQLTKIATKASDVATVFGADFEGVTNAVAQLLRTHLVKSASGAFNLITRGMQSGANKAGDLLDTINEYSTQWRKTGITGSTALGLINQGLAAGARDSDIVADAIKEFSIRAVDGSVTTKAGFKALGLDAKDTAAQFGKGGKAATKVLDITLDRLRAIKDPVKQAQAAVNLFGTQAEDLGAALFALDPSKAARGLGTLSGAASSLGDVVRGGPSYELQTFTRILKQDLVNFLGAKVVPVINNTAAALRQHLQPPVTTLAVILGHTLVPAVVATTNALIATGGWLRKWGIWLSPLAVLIGGVTIAMTANAAATGASTLIYETHFALLLAGETITKGFTAAQETLNAVMELNPIALVVIALVALGVALVVAWKKSDTFRSVVMGAWQGIQTAASYTWNSILKPAFAGIITAATAVGEAAVWLWQTILKPAFAGIALAARIMATVIGVLVVGPMILAFRLLAPVVTWLWQAVIKPAFAGIAAAAVWLYTTAIAPQLHAIQAAVHAVGAAAMWLWRAAFLPALQGIGAAATWLWRGAISPALHGIGAVAVWLYVHAIRPQLALARAALSALGTGARAARDVIAAALHGIGSVVSWLYTRALKPELDAGRRLVGAFADAFKTAKDAIGTEWHKLEAIAKKPIAFIINTVYNAGLVPVWNKVASAFGAPKLGKFKGFATGGIEGVRPGYTPGRDTHLIAVGGGEAIMRPEWTRAVGPGYVNAANAAARAGGVGAVRRMVAGGLPAFAGGGIFGWIGKKAAGAGSAVWDTVKKSASWLKDTLAASARAGVRAVVDPLLARIPGAGSGFGQMVRRIPRQMIDALFGYAKQADKKGASAAAAAAGGGRLGQWIARAMALTHVPASWAAPLRTLIMRESGGNPRAINLTDINALHGDPSRGLMQTIGTTFEHYRLKSLVDDIYDPIANIVAGIRYILARYGSIFHVQQANPHKPPKGYAGGGSPRPGEIAWVGENGPELIRFSGGEVVYSHPQSMRMAAGLGGLRGFASGTASARRQLPGDLSGLTRALAGSVADIARAAKELVKDLKAAGGAGKLLATSTAKAATRLEGLARRRDAVASKLAAGKQAAADQASTIRDFLGLSNLGDAGSIGEVISGLTARQDTVKASRARLSAARRRGASQGLITQLVGLGPDSALAQMIEGASAGQLKQLNALVASGGKLASVYGHTVADLMFDAGKDAGRGFLTGLVSQEKALEKEMSSLGGVLVSSIEHRLGIHSPSRVTHGIGQRTGQGLELGLDSTTTRIAAAAARMADAATPPMPALAAPAGPAAGGLAAGSRLRLVVGGREFDAYVEDLADGRVAAGFHRAGRRAGAGRK